MITLQEYQGMKIGDTIAFRHVSNTQEIQVCTVESWKQHGDDVILQTSDHLYVVSVDIVSFVTLEEIKKIKSYWDTLYRQLKTDHIENLMNFLEEVLIHSDDYTTEEVLTQSLHHVQKIESDRYSTFAERTAKDFLKNFYYHYIEQPHLLAAASDEYDALLKGVLTRIGSCRNMNDECKI